MEIDLLRQEEYQAWDSYVAAHPLGHIYHTIAWKQVTEEGFGHVPYYLRAVNSQGIFTGVLPLFLVDGIYGRRLVSVPMRDRGHVIADDSSVASSLVLKAIEISNELQCKYIELKSFHEVPVTLPAGYSLMCDQDWVATRIDLTPGVDKLWKMLDKDAVRWSVRKAQKNGVTVEIESTEAAVDLFYEMFSQTRSSMGIPPFPKQLFHAIRKHMIDKGIANLFIARKDSIPINAMINFLSKDTFIAAYAAPQNEWRQYNPSDVVFWNTIAWAAGEGYRHYDFGADSVLQTSLLWYKKKWAGVQHPMYYYYYSPHANSLPNFDSSSPAYSMLRRVWRHLPISVSKPLGSWVTRQLS